MDDQHLQTTFGHQEHSARVIRLASVEVGEGRHPTFLDVLELMTPRLGQPPAYYQLVGEANMRELNRFLTKYLHERDVERMTLKAHQDHLSNCPIRKENPEGDCPDCSAAYDYIGD